MSSQRTGLQGLVGMNPSDPSVPAVLLELVTSPAPFGAHWGAKETAPPPPLALPAVAPFPSKAEIRPAYTRGKLYSVELTFPDFEEETDQTIVFDRLLEAMTMKLGKPKLSRKNNKTESRRGAAWNVGGHPLRLWSWDLWNEGHNIRQVGVEYRDRAHASAAELKSAGISG